MNKDHRRIPHRIILLPDAEIEELYNIPTFTDIDQEEFFALSKIEYELLDNYRTQKLKIYFILQLGYFKATRQFYDFNFVDIQNDLSHIMHKYFDVLDLNSLIGKIDQRTIKVQRIAILQLYNYTNWSKELTPKIIEHLSELIKYYPKTSNALRELFKYFQNKQIVIPKYRALQDIFFTVLGAEETRLAEIICQIPDKIKLELLELTKDSDNVKQLNVLKGDQKDFQYTAVKMEVKKARKIEHLYQFCKSFIPKLGVSGNGIRYYSELVENYYTSRLRKMNESQQLLYLVCFISNQYQQLMDNLIASFQYHMNSILNDATTYSQAELIKYSASLALEFPKLAKFLQWFPTQETTSVNITKIELIQKGYTILPKRQFLLIADFIEGKTFDKTKAKWESYKKSTPLFSRYLRPVILNIEFELIDSKAPLIALIALIKNHYAKGKYPGTLRLKISDLSLPKITKSMIQYLKNERDPEYFDPYLLEFYIYKKMRPYITRGQLVCNNSMSYGDLDNDLIPDHLVDKALEIAIKFGYHKIPIFCDKYLDEQLQNLNDAWERTDTNITNGTNKFIEIINGKTPEDEPSWKLIYDPKEKLEGTFFTNLPKIEIVNLFKFIGDLTKIWDSFTHIKHRYIKRHKPISAVLNACVLSEAFGLSIQQMAEICDINLNSLISTREDLVRVETILSANDVISNYVNGLTIFKTWNLLDGKLLADADGQKHPSNNKTLQSRYSKKYLGKGISLYSLMANNIVVNAKTIGLNEYEGHGLYDVVYGNKSNIIIDYVTGDNHSINHVNYVILDSVDVGYLPSIKNIKKEAEKLCSAQDITKYTGVIKPKSEIDVALIKSHTRWITRVLLSLIMQQNTQTTIVRKLSTHDKYSSARSALHKYNKIFKTIHILNMINDINLRKAIKAARNCTEAYHQLQRAIRKVYNGTFKGKNKCSFYQTYCQLHYCI